MDSLEDLVPAIAAGRTKRVEELIQAAIAARVPTEDILRVVQAGAETVRRWDANEFFVPEILITARGVKQALWTLDPLLDEAQQRGKGHVVIGTVHGDLHDFGKNMVAARLQCNGYGVTDVGVDVRDQQFVEAAEDHPRSIVAISALLTTTMLYMRDVIGAIDRAGLRSRGTKVLVGGAPVTKTFAEEIRADGYGETSSDAVREVERLLRTEERH